MKGGVAGSVEVGSVEVGSVKGGVAGAFIGVNTGDAAKVRGSPGEYIIRVHWEGTAVKAFQKSVHNGIAGWVWGPRSALGTGFQKMFYVSKDFRYPCRSRRSDR